MHLLTRAHPIRKYLGILVPNIIYIIRISSNTNPVSPTWVGVAALERATSAGSARDIVVAFELAFMTGVTRDQCSGRARVLNMMLHMTLQHITVSSYGLGIA